MMYPTFAQKLEVLTGERGGWYALGAHTGHFHGWCLGVHLAWAFASQDLVVHIESVSGSAHMLHTVSNGLVGGLYPVGSAPHCVYGTV
jgi:hypothetical protein